MLLVKWLLVIPHVLILGVLGAVDFIIYLIAYVAILFSGRFPRGLFDFSLNIMRWEWRVTFYSHGLLGTDHYPPPTGLTIECPERLSWLLLHLKCPPIIRLVMPPHPHHPQDSRYPGLDRPARGHPPVKLVTDSYPLGRSRRGLHGADGPQHQPCSLSPIRSYQQPGISTCDACSGQSSTTVHHVWLVYVG